VKPRELLFRANRVQQTTIFKVVASIVVLTAAIAGFVTYTVVATAPSGMAPIAAQPEEAAPQAAAPGEDRSAIEAGQRILRDVLASRTDPVNVGIGIAVLAAVALTVVWLDLGLTYLGLLALAAGVAWPLSALGMPSASRLVVGVVALTASFSALMQALRGVLAAPNPVFAVARNVLAEAVRMNISLVFLVLLVFGLAALPGMLNAESPLRYRVQSFLQYGTGGSFWLIAILVVVFGVATVAFEQRDKQIWQTMTKPVASWQYLLGKWLGLVGLSGVLLAVCCSGVFLFTEHLRQQPALGEERASASAAATGLEQSVSEDRYVLETQVLAARQSVEPTLPLDKSDPGFLNAVNDYVQAARKTNPDFATTQGMLDKVKDDLFKGAVQAYRTIEPMQQERYVFQGLGPAREAGLPLTLRYKIQSGDNAPNKIYRITFLFHGKIEQPQEVGLDQTQTLNLYPTVIDENGTVELIVVNGDILRGMPNERSVTFPGGGLTLSYAVGTYRMNYLRVAMVLWVKLAFLAMLAVTTATFLSFPVAVFVALCAFLAAESAGYLSNALEYWSTVDKGKIQVFNFIVALIGQGVVAMFRTYTELRPTQKLVDGLLVSWGSVAWGAGILVGWSAALFGGAVLIFRRRELATYSGQ
jgi:ABC-type transport system involved in multi-copper enzyme maturation permease subunit